MTLTGTPVFRLSCEMIAKVGSVSPSAALLEVMAISIGAVGGTVTFTVNVAASPASEDFGYTLSA